ncbi:MAG: transglutaminase domain-containing protein [Halobacteriales archaeon]
MTRVLGRLGGSGTGRIAALPPGLLRAPTAGVAVAVAAYLGVLFGVADVVGSAGALAAAVGLAVLAATASARLVSPRTAVLAAVALLAAGLLGYYLSVPPDVREVFTPTNVVVDALRLLTGISVLRLVRVDAWVLATTPIPTFLAWYLAGRGRHVQAALVAGGTLGFLVLTGDAGVGATLLGVLGVTLAVGLSTLSVPSGIRTQWDTFAALLAVMVVLPATISAFAFGGVVPTSAGSAPGLESSVTGTSESLDVVGRVGLSPAPRFRVESPVKANWQVASYDRYTGSGWVRTGEPDLLGGSVDAPPGETTTVRQNVTALSRLELYPTVWKPVSVAGPTAETAELADGGTINPRVPINTGETVRIESAVLRTSPARLRAAGTDYPDAIRERYTQLPESTPDRVANLTRRVTADAGTPYDAAVAIERYLPRVKNYSLSVSRPDGDIADSFLFEMRAGYCTYFATAMVAMLRSQGVPARLATGYTAGTEVSDGEWLVRAQDAHAWVQVYFPGQGWVNFDPTPAAARETARDRRLQAAEESGAGVAGVAVVTEVVTPGEDTPTPTRTAAGNGSSDEDLSAEVARVIEQGIPGESQSSGDATGTVINTASGATTPTETPIDPAAEGDDGDGSGPLPDRRTTGYAVLLLIGGAAVAHGTGATRRASRTVWLHVQLREGPARDVERAFGRLQALLAGRYRERRPRETPRAYLAAVGADDARMARVLEIYERSRYGDETTREEADEAVRAVDGIVADATPILGRPLRRIAGVARWVRSHVG